MAEPAWIEPVAMATGKTKFKIVAPSDLFAGKQVSYNARFASAAYARKRARELGYEVLGGLCPLERLSDQDLRRYRNQYRKRIRS